MLRRIPFVPMLFGAFAALALLSVFAIAEPLLNNVHVFAAGAAIGAAYVLPLYAFSPLIRGEPRSRARAAGRGCLYAAAGYFTLIVVALLIAIITAGNVQITGWNAIASLLAFAGLGILGGLMFARFRAAEAERQRGALERQQLELARNLQQRLLPLVCAEQPNPAPLLGRLNERLTGQLPPREFVAMALALYHASAGTVTIANAGLPDPLLVSSAKAIVVSGPRYPIGVRKVIAYESICARLGRAERLILFTDGLPEAPVGGEPIGDERLTAEVKRAEGDIDTLFAGLEKLGAAHDDDWTAVLLQAR